jgi:hypothetical protein
VIGEDENMMTLFLTKMSEESWWEKHAGSSRVIVEQDLVFYFDLRNDIRMMRCNVMRCLHPCQWWRGDVHRSVHECNSGMKVKWTSSWTRGSRDEWSESILIWQK